MHAQRDRPPFSRATCGESARPFCPRCRGAAVHDPTVLEPVDRVGRTHAELPAAGGHHEELNRTQFDEPEPAPAAWVRSPG